MSALYRSVPLNWLLLYSTVERDSSAKGPKIADTCKSPDVHSNASRGILGKEFNLIFYAYWCCEFFL